MTKISQKPERVELQDKLRKLLVPETISIKQALKKMDEGGEKILFIVDEEQRLRGTLTDGDIRRWLIHEGALEEAVSSIARKNPKTVNFGDGIDRARQIMVEAKVEVLPIIDSKRQVVGAYFWTDIFDEMTDSPHMKIDAPVFIMAGGKGARLDPFTKILPKPLIPLGEKPIIEVIMDNFARYGCKTFYLSVNYKGKMIESYFENTKHGYDLRYVREESPLGTAGSLSLISDLRNAPAFFVTNCDVVIKADYADIWHYHHQTEANITIVGSMRHFSVPYGVIETRNGGNLDRIIEKPEYDFLVNTGLYVLNHSVLAQIPANTPLDFPELIARVKTRGGKVQVYPVSEKSWLDAGEWQEYHNILKDLGL